MSHSNIGQQVLGLLLLLCRFKAHRQLWSFSAQEVVLGLTLREILDYEIGSWFQYD